MLVDINICFRRNCSTIFSTVVFNTTAYPLDYFYLEKNYLIVSIIANQIF